MNDLTKKVITILKEEEVPVGLKTTKKVQKDSKANNDEYLKDSEKRLKDAYSDISDDEMEDNKFNYRDDEQKEYHDQVETLNGLEMNEYEAEPNERFKDRAEEAIVGSSRMGNNPEWGNVATPEFGGDPEFGKKLVKRVKDSKKKRDDSKIGYFGLGDDIELTKGKDTPKSLSFESIINKITDKKIDVSSIFEGQVLETNENNSNLQEEEHITETKKMKRLKFNKIFNGVDNALKLIPENYKVDGKKFQMTDGIETITIKWDGNLFEGSPIVVSAENSKLIAESKSRIKDLMTFNSKAKLGTPNKEQRSQEDYLLALNLKKLKENKVETKEVIAENVQNNASDKFKAQRLDLGNYDGKFVSFKKANYLKEDTNIVGIEYHIMLENTSLPKDVLSKEIVETNKNKKPSGKIIKFSFYDSKGNILEHLNKEIK